MEWICLSLVVAVGSIFIYSIYVGKFDVPCVYKEED